MAVCLIQRLRSASCCCKLRTAQNSVVTARAFFGSNGRCGCRNTLDCSLVVCNRLFNQEVAAQFFPFLSGSDRPLIDERREQCGQRENKGAYEHTLTILMKLNSSLYLVEEVRARLDSRCRRQSKVDAKGKERRNSLC